MVNSDNGGTLKIKLDEDTSDKVYLLRFTLEKPQSCKIGDTSISVNGVINKLTCKSWKYFRGRNIKNME